MFPSQGFSSERWQIISYQPLKFYWILWLLNITWFKLAVNSFMSLCSTIPPLILPLPTGIKSNEKFQIVWLYLHDLNKPWAQIWILVLVAKFTLLVPVLITGLTPCWNLTQLLFSYHGHRPPGLGRLNPVPVPLFLSPFPTLPASFSLQQYQTSLKQALVTWIRYFHYYQWKKLKLEIVTDCKNWPIISAAVVPIGKGKSPDQGCVPIQQEQNTSPGSPVFHMSCLIIKVMYVPLVCFSSEAAYFHKTLVNSLAKNIPSSEARSDLF